MTQKLIIVLFYKAFAHHAHKSIYKYDMATMSAAENERRQPRLAVGAVILLQM